MKKVQQLGGINDREYGEKASRLVQAEEMGLLIPVGLALTYQDFDAFIEGNGLISMVQEDIVCGPRLRQRITEGKFSEEFQEMLHGRLERLQQSTGCHSFVVRSSSNSEDGRNSSMAGMFESYLKLTNYDEVEGAIRKCYSSLYSDKVLNYAYENGLSGTDRKMGIVIQEYIEGEAFGVMFTTDPVSGEKDQIQFSMFEGDSARMLQLAPNTGIFSLHKQNGTLTPLSSTQDANPPSHELCNQLISLAQNCERLFGLPMDIEWTLRDGRLYLLQARPITTLRDHEFIPEWNNTKEASYQWFRLYPEPLKPLMQDIIISEISNQSKGSYETMFRTDTFGEGTIINGYAYVRNIPIEGEAEKRKEYLTYLEELAGRGSCIYHDVHLHKIQEYLDRLKEFVSRELTAPETVEFLKLAMEYHDYCARYHWHMVQANEFLYRFERECLTTFPKMAFTDFYELVSGYTLMTRDREYYFHMADVVNQSITLKKMFETCSYDAVLYQRLLHCEEAKELLSILDQYLADYGICDSYEGEELIPVLQERPDRILGNLRKVLDMDSSEFYENIRTAVEKKDKVLEQIMIQLDEKEENEFRHKLVLAEKAFLTNDNHNYHVERLYRGYLRLAVSRAEEILLDQGVIKEKDDIQYLHYHELLVLLQSMGPENQLIENRKKVYETQKKLAAPEMLAVGMAEEDQAKSIEGFIQKMGKNRDPLNIEELPMILKGVSGMKKRVRGRVFVGIPEQPQDAILVMPHCHYGDIMPVISKVKGLIFLWGSPYDHPAIIARELGIPAMYYVPGVMELLKTGDEVEIDGYEGLIRIISRVEDQDSGICK